MIDAEVEKIINRLHKLRAVDQTREPLRPPERELNAEPEVRHWGYPGWHL